MPAPAPETDAPPKTELQELQLKATEKTDEASEIDCLAIWFKLILSYFLVSRIDPPYAGIMRRGKKPENVGSNSHSEIKFW